MYFLLPETNEQSRVIQGPRGGGHYIYFGCGNVPSGTVSIFTFLGMVSIFMILILVQGTVSIFTI